MHRIRPVAFFMAVFAVLQVMGTAFPMYAQDIVIAAAAGGAGPSVSDLRASDEPRSVDPEQARSVPADSMPDETEAVQTGAQAPGLSREEQARDTVGGTAVLLLLICGVAVAVNCPALCAGLKKPWTGHK